MISEKNERDEASSSCSNTADHVSLPWRKQVTRERHTLRVLITQCPLAHVRQLDGSLRASIHKPVTTGRVEFGRGDNFGEFFHVGRFDIDNVETLVLDVKVPEVDSEIIAAYEGLSVTVDGDAVDVVCMGVCICPPRYGCDNGVMVCHPGKLQ